MPVVKSRCERRERNVVYTGVDAEGEIRYCPGCGCEVVVDPSAGDVPHLKAE